MAMMARYAFGTLLFITATSFGNVAHAEPAVAPNPMRAAGWAVIGIGASLGLGSVASGSFLYLNPASGYEEQRVGGATLIGGVVTVAVALVVGIPMLVTGSSTSATSAATPGHGVAYDSKSPSVTLARALTGEVRF